MYEDLMKPNEDWTNLSNSVERRRIQNRIAQRAYRRNMRERTNEVQRLRERISELEDKEAGNSFDALFSALPDTPPDDPVAFVQESRLEEKDLFEGEDRPINYEDKNWTRLSKKDSIAVTFSSSSPKTVNDLEAPLESLNPERKDAPLVTSRRSRSQAIYTPQKRPAPASSMMFERNKLRDKGDEKGFPPIFSPVRDPQFASKAESTPLFESDQFLMGHSSQHFHPTPSVTPSINVKSSIPQMPGYEKKPFARHGRGHTLPSSPKVDSDKQISPLSGGHASLLHLAVMSGNVDTLRLLLQDYRIATSGRDAAGYTPLERAVVCGRPDLVAILLEHDIGVAVDDGSAEPDESVELELGRPDLTM